jgi:RNA polymerase sigma-70 factor (ECF subfamily)
VVLVEADVRRRMNGGPLDDVAFMARLARGDLDAVRALYGRFGRPLYAYIRSLVDDEGLAEEVVQDTFVAAWRSAARFENRSSLTTWLFGIARRQARDRMRRSRPETGTDELLEGLPAADPEPEAAALASASRAELAVALKRLPDADREVIVLSFAYELSGPEIAEVLGVPEGTVKSRLFKARRRLRAQLVERDG